MISEREFGKTPDGKSIKAFTLTNKNGIEAVVIEWGATLASLLVPDKNGVKADVVLGFDTLEEYMKNDYFLGVTVGRNANRIAGAKATIDGVIYDLVKNDGENNLHTDPEKGFHMRPWEGKAEEGSNSVIFFLEEQDMFTGFPGNLEITVTYRLTDDNELLISYHGVSDKNTILNCTNHSYFNLAGHDSGSAMDQFIQINAERFVAVGNDGIPTGELRKVEGTPFDLRKAVRMSDHIDDDYDQLKAMKGYDHSFEISGEVHKMRLAAVSFDEKSGRRMETLTDLPGVQFYTANFMGDVAGKGNAKYGRRHAFCLETNYFPDSANQESFESPIFGPDKEYNTSTVYKFSTI